MYNLKGFIRIDNQQNNTIGVVSTLGELSTQSMTYSREKGIYKNDAITGISFVSFTSKFDNNATVAVPQDYSDHILQVCNRMITYSAQYGNSITVQAIANDVFNNFQSLVFDFESGPLVSTSTLTLPEWVSWQNPLYNNGDNRIKVWFSDQAFKRQFEDYSILILNPVDDLMDLMRDVTITERSLSNRSRDREMELIASLKDGEPETNIRAQTYTLTHILQPNKTFTLTWYAIVNGQAGDNPDIIKDRIIEELGGTSTVTLTEWRQAIPDLFNTTEFVLVPKWMNQAIPDRQAQAGIYSPFTSIKHELETIISLFNDIDPIHVNENLQVLSIPYRSLSIFSLSGLDNLNDLNKLTDKYSDLINVGTASADFSRMSISTQNFANMLEELVMIAENEVDYAELPVYVRRVTRYGKLWISRKFDNIQYLIYAKSNDVGN